MTLYRITSDRLETVPPTTFAVEGLLERRDLQRLLRQDISVLADDLLVIAEEFGEWEESRRSIDLLCLNKGADLVVVELKRTEDGGHMELQAIRYAAMVSGMTLDKAIDKFASLRRLDRESARREVVDFLQLDGEAEVGLSGEVRIILGAADFSTELTTAILWLNTHELDITCVRLKPYRLGNDVLIDVAQIIPLPEAADYAVKLREQERERRQGHGERQEILRRFWASLIDRSQSRTQLLANRSATDDPWLTVGIGRGGFSLGLSLTQEQGCAEFYVRLAGGEEPTRSAFRRLLAHKEDIEATFGENLEWNEVPGRRTCRIRKVFPGGWRSPEVEWPEIQDRLIDGLIRLDRALRDLVQGLAV